MNNKKQLQLIKEKYLKNQKEKELKNKILQITVQGNSLKIENYYKSKINLQDFLPKKTIRIMKNGLLKKIEITDTIEVVFVNCYFKEITDYLSGIKIIRLNKCFNFEKIPRNLQNDLTELTIDDKVIQLLS